MPELPRTTDEARAAIRFHLHEVQQEMSKESVDTLLIEELLSLCIYDNRRIRTAQNLAQAHNLAALRPTSKHMQVVLGVAQ